MKTLESSPSPTAAPESPVRPKVRARFRTGIAIGALLLSALAVLWFVHRSGFTVDPSRLTDEITIRDWRLIGPFRLSQDAIKAQKPDHEAAGLDRDYLSELGYPESIMDAVKWNALSQRTGLSQRRKQRGAFLPLDEIFPKVEFAVVYAATNIRSASEGDVALSVGSDDGVKVWVDGRLIIATPDTITRGAQKYSNCSIVHLRRGDNFVLAKVDQKRNGWLLVMNLSSKAQAGGESAAYHRRRLILDRFPEPGQPLKLDLPLLQMGRPVRFAIQNRFGTEVYSRNIEPGGDAEVALPPHVIEGYFTCTLRVGAELLQDEFFLGDWGRVMQALVAARRRVPSGSRQPMAIDALIERHSQLDQPGRQMPKDANWQKKILPVLRDGLRALDRPDSVAWFKSPGTHLRAYASAIDGQIQHYVLHVPKNAGGRVPLVVIMPPEVGWPRPMLESVLLWDSAILDIYAGEAERQGMAMAMILGRGNTHNAPIGETDFFEVLEDIRRDLNLDDQRLYLYGVCEGGRRAFLLAGHHPDLFAAVGSDGALAGGYGDAVYPPLRKWWSHGLVAAAVGNLASVPIILTRGDEDAVVPIADTLEIFNAARAVKGRVELQMLRGNGHTYSAVIAESVVFPLLATHRSIRVPGELQFKAETLTHAASYWIRARGSADSSQPIEVDARIEGRNLAVNTRNVSGFEILPERLSLTPGGQIQIDWNGKRAVIPYIDGTATVGDSNVDKAAERKRPGMEGPVFDALAHPFLVAIGTGGSKAARRSAAQAASAFEKGWQTDFFVSCRMKPDTAVRAEDLKAYHLVLFGTPAAGSLLAQPAASLAVAAHGDGVSIGEHKYPGDKLTYAAVFPNPLDPSRYLVVIGSNSDRWTLPEAHLALRGAFDYSVWDGDGKPMDSGLFDRNWK